MKTYVVLQNTHKDLFVRKELNQSNQVPTDTRKYKELEQKLHDEQARHQKLTSGKQCSYIILETVLDIFIKKIICLAIWNEHQTKIDMAHKLLRSAQDKLEDQIRLRKEQVNIH